MKFYDIAKISCENSKSSAFSRRGLGGAEGSRGNLVGVQ